MNDSLRKMLRLLAPFPLRVWIGRALRGRNLRDLTGRLGAGGLHAYVAWGVSARRWRHVQIGAGTQVDRGTHFHSNDEEQGKRIVIGERCFVGPNCFLSAGERIEIRQDTVLGAACHLLAAGHRYDDPTRAVAKAEVVSYGPLVLGVNSWIGVGAIIVGGVEVGYGAIVAAGSLLRTSVPPLCLAAGHPARVIKTYDWISKSWSKLPGDECARAAALERHVQNLPGEATYLAALGT